MRKPAEAFLPISNSLPSCSLPSASPDVEPFPHRRDETLEMRRSGTERRYATAAA